LQEADRAAIMNTVAENPEPKLHKGNMAAELHKPIMFILLFAITLAMVSLPTEALVDVGDQAVGDACCAHDGGSSTHTNSVPDDEECCSSGCKDCFLPCCGGLLSSPVFSEILDPIQSPTGSVTHYCDSSSLYYPKEIYHPPRL
jgi:hypothetical protein